MFTRWLASVKTSRTGSGWAPSQVMRQAWLVSDPEGATPSPNPWAQSSSYPSPATQTFIPSRSSHVTPPAHSVRIVAGTSHWPWFSSQCMPCPFAVRQQAIQAPNAMSVNREGKLVGLTFRK